MLFPMRFSRTASRRVAARCEAEGGGSIVSERVHELNGLKPWPHLSLFLCLQGVLASEEEDLPVAVDITDAYSGEFSSP